MMTIEMKGGGGMRNSKPKLLIGLTVCSVLIILSGCSTPQQVVTSPNPPDVPEMAGVTSSTAPHQSFSAQASHSELMPSIRKASNLAILFHALEVSVFTHAQAIFSDRVESLRQTLMAYLRQEQLFERVVASSLDYENTSILNARVMSWEEDEIEVNLTVATRCGCQLGEALGKGTTQVTELSADHPGDVNTVPYDLTPVAQGAVNTSRA